MAAWKRKKGTGRRRHMNHDRRLNFCSFLNDDHTIQECARLLHISKTTAYREAKRGLDVKENSVVQCPHRRRHYVCNGCPRKNLDCAFGRVFYNPDIAEEDAQTRKRVPHEGTRLPPEEFEAAVKIIRDGVKRGISPEVICRGNGEEKPLPVSPSTVRRWIRQGKIEGLCNINLLRAKRYKKAYARPKTANAEQVQAQKGGHRMSDFLDFLDASRDPVLIETDSVIGTKTDTQRILTVMFLEQHLQYGVLYPVATASKSVAAEFSRLLEALMPKVQGKTVVILADNGFEFDNLIPLEKRFPGVKVFYTAPYKATDKPHCERNHEELRKRIPKGSSFAHLTQKDVSWAFSCIDSLIVESLGWKSPCELFAGAYGSDLMEHIGIRKIPYSKIDLSPIR